MSNPTDVEVLVKPECHLCAEALQVTEEACAEFGLEYRTTNITDDADLAAQFAEEIPVLRINGAVRDALAQLDGSRGAAVAMLADIDESELDDLGGVPKA